MESSHEADHSNESKGLWYTYFGETGASTVAFLYIIFLFSCIYSFLRWG